MMSTTHSSHLSDLGWGGDSPLAAAGSPSVWSEAWPATYIYRERVKERETHTHNIGAYI